MASEPAAYSDFARGQEQLADTLRHGPAALPSDLFAGASDRVLLGLKAHANTISHARLVALEHTYPRTRERIGDGQFNWLSRSFVSAPHVLPRDSRNIGRGFASHLACHDESSTTVDLAEIEWAWLEAYHAIDVPPVTLEQLSRLRGAEMFDLRIAIHPAARLISLSAPLASQLHELAASRDCAALLVTRPESDVRFLPQELVETRFFLLAGRCKTLGNLLQSVAEQDGESTAQALLLAFVKAGALAHGDAALRS